MGRFGPATVSWSIKKDNIPNTEAARNTFNATSGSVDFVDGQEQFSVVLEVSVTRMTNYNHWAV